MSVKTTPAAAQEAKHGEKMIEVKLRFGPTTLRNFRARSSPSMRGQPACPIERNDSHGIKPGAPLPFHSLLDVGAVIEKVLIEHGIVLHPAAKWLSTLEAVTSGLDSTSKCNAD